MTFGKVAAHWLRESESVLYLCVSREGRLRSWNPAVSRRLGRTEEELRNLQLRTLLAEDEAERILRVATGTDADKPRLVNFVDAEQAPITLSCRLYPEGDTVHIVGTDLVGERDQLEEKLLSLSQEMVVLGREEARRSRELEAMKEKLQETLEELENSYWHLKKVQEVIPLCMFCGRIRDYESSWEEVAEYLKKNSILVSHGLCPECQIEHYGEELEEGASGDLDDDGLDSPAREAT